MNRQKIKDFFIGLFLLILSPIYVTLGALWGYRYEILDFYEDCFRAITFQDSWR